MGYYGFQVKAPEVVGLDDLYPISNTCDANFLTSSLEGKKLSDVLRGLAQDIARIALRTAITKPLGEAISGAIGGTITGMFGGGPKKIHSKAHGGVIPPNSLSFVGERGTEMVRTGSQSATVTPTGGMGGTTNISFNILANDTRGFDQLLTERRPMIEGMIQSAYRKQGLKGMQR